MATHDGRYTITFNGEIYNYRELRAELEKAGISFRSHSDTEVILQLYATRGASGIARLRGMYAFAIWDDREKTAFLARDAFGIKPLYYCLREGTLAFASEVRAFISAGFSKGRLSVEGLVGYLCTGSVPEPFTLLDDIRCLEAGECLVWREGKVTKSKLESAPDARIAHQESVNGELKVPAAKAVRSALIDTVRHHFISDVPVGVFLSGGIDSTALVALGKHIGHEDLRTFSIALDSPSLNEGEVARRTAGHFGTRHSEWLLDEKEGAGLFQQYLTCIDQPSVDGFNTYCVSRFAHQCGMKVVLSGLGGDELFGGYPSFSKVPEMVRWGARFDAVAPVKRLAGNALERCARDPRWKRLGDYLRQPASVAAAYRCYRGIFTIREALRLAGSIFAKAGQSDTSWDLKSMTAALGWDDSASYGLLSSATLGEQVGLLELTRYMRNQLLRDSDVMSMAWGLELRVPFVDRHLVNVVSGIPPAIRFQTGKRLLLDAVPEIPDWVANQPKRGFRFPFEQWLGGEWKETFESVRKESPVPLRTWYRQWTLFVLQRWMEQARQAR